MSGQKILIIDDDRSTREALQTLFIARNWEVAMAESQDRGLALLTDQEPDWVLVAWDQLAGTGDSFIKKVKACPHVAKVALLTDTMGGGEDSFMKRLRVDLRFAKPLIPEEVFRACASDGKAELVAV
ncbi:MAG: hypothetical protein NVSMB9_29280 [Isosphaeraceae bacterium]